MHLDELPHQRQVESSGTLRSDEAPIEFQNPVARSLPRHPKAHRALMLRVAVGELTAVAERDGGVLGHCHVERGAGQVGVPVECRSRCAEDGGVVKRLQVDS